MPRRARSCYGRFILEKKTLKKLILTGACVVALAAAAFAGVVLWRSQTDDGVPLAVRWEGLWIDYNVRGYSHGFYRRGQDSAGLRQTWRASAEERCADQGPIDGHPRHLRRITQGHP